MRIEQHGDGTALRITVSARVAPKATQRNRARRRIREALRTMTGIPRDRRIAVTVHDANLPPLPVLRGLLMELIRESGIVNR